MSAASRFAWSLHLAQTCNRDGYPALARAYVSEALVRARRLRLAERLPHGFLRRRGAGGQYRFCHAQVVRLPVDRCIGRHGASLRGSIRALQA